MFYCKHEQKATTKRMKRRQALDDTFKEIMADAAIVGQEKTKHDYTEEELADLTKILDINFPGIDKKNTTISGHTLLPTNSETGTSQNLSTANSILAKTSLAMAQSLDTCLGELTDKSTVSALQQNLQRTSVSGVSPTVNRSVAKEWCNDVADMLSSVHTTDATDAAIKSSVTMLQSIIEKSSGLGAVVGDSNTSTEEKKPNEDEIPLSVAGSSLQSVERCSSKLQDWVTAVTSELEMCAEELDMEEEQNSLQFSGTSEGSSNGLSSSSVDGGMEGDDEPKIGKASVKTSSLKSLSKSSPSDDFWAHALSPRRAKSLPITTQKNDQTSFKVSSLESREELLWKEAASPKMTGSRTREITISTVGMSQTGRKKSEINSLLNEMKESHGHSHKINMKTPHSQILLGLFLFLTAFSFSAMATLGFFQALWTWIQ